MSLKSLSMKLYLGIAVAALVAWVAGVPGRTIVSLAAVGFMLAMHAGGHGGHGDGPHADRGAGTSHPRHTGAATPVASIESADHAPRLPTQRGSASRGCH
jgi:hypothetical protein